MLRPEDREFFFPSRIFLPLVRRLPPEIIGRSIYTRSKTELITSKQAF